MNHIGKIGIGLICVLSVAWWGYNYSQLDTEKSIHYHAGFRVYINDMRQDYSGYQYMNYVSCSEHDQKKTAEEEQVEKAHLHDNIGDVVHVHRNGAVWGDLFRNAKIELPSDLEMKGFIEGVEVEDYMKAEIEPYATLILNIGESNTSRSGERVERAWIEEVELKSELCGS